MATDIDALEEERIFEAAGKLLKERNMFDLSDSCPAADFQRDMPEHLDRLRQTGRPTVLTVNGKAELVVHSAEAFQQLMERLDYAETVVGTLKGRESVRRGDTLPLDEAFEQIRNGTWRRSP
jgi:PHD/YefM family antitoxin component YafN of YafNO toxin-antitoxin module